MKLENSNGTETVRATGNSAWALATLAVFAITITLGSVILKNQGHTIETVDRLILNGEGNGNGHEHIMHYTKLTRRDGSTASLEVSGAASVSNVKDIIRTFAAGGEDPPTWKVTEWTIAGGTTIKVSTPPLDGETPLGEAHCARHDAFVDELQEEFPPI